MDSDVVKHHVHTPPVNIQGAVRSYTYAVVPFFRNPIQIILSAGAAKDNRLMYIQHDHEFSAGGNKMYDFLKKENSGIKPEPHEIKVIEDSYGFEFPQILFDFYLLHNVGTIKLCTFEIDGFEHQVRNMVPLKEGALTFEEIVTNDRKDGFIDTNMLPLAMNEGGDMYYWDKNNENVYLYYWDDIENPIFISENIKSFFELLSQSIDEGQ